MLRRWSSSGARPRLGRSVTSPAEDAEGTGTDVSSAAAPGRRGLGVGSKLALSVSGLIVIVAFIAVVGGLTLSRSNAGLDHLYAHNLRVVQVEADRSSVAFSLLVGALIVVLLSRNIVPRIRRYSEFATEIAAARPTGRLVLGGSDEITTLGAALNDMTGPAPIDGRPRGEPGRLRGRLAGGLHRAGGP